MSYRNLNLAFLFFLSISVYGQSIQVYPSAALHRLEKSIPRLMKQADVPGASVALIEDSRLVWTKGYGKMNTRTGKPISARTVFEANSLSKPPFAYAVLRLVDNGKLHLDTPLVSYTGSDTTYCSDPRIGLVTARMVLCHSSGLEAAEENSSGKKVQLRSEPGTKFHYSPEGFFFLQKAVEKITAMPIESFMDSFLLRPLHMDHSSYVWRRAYDSLLAYPHDWWGKAATERQKWDHGAACCSLVTTPGDYAKFVLAVMKGDLLSHRSWAALLEPQIRVPDTAGTSDTSAQLYWGLGWGLEITPEGTSFWHWGDGEGSKDYVTGSLTQGDAIIFLSNSDNGLSFIRELVDDAMGGQHPAIAYLDFERYDAPSRRLLRQILAKGAMTALLECRNNKSEQINESQMNVLGYKLMSLKKIGDALAVFRENSVRHPMSGNVWDSLAEVYMDLGNKKLAIRYYKRSLALDPFNNNAADMLKKLQGL